MWPFAGGCRSYAQKSRRTNSGQVTIGPSGGYVLANTHISMSVIRSFLPPFVQLFLSFFLIGAFAVTARPLQTKVVLVDSAHTKPKPPNSLTFTASTDQRFFFFGDTRNENDRRIPVSVYGIRAGFLFPSGSARKGLTSGRSASFKAGAGFYFVNQQLNRPGLLPNTSAQVTRHLRIATLYYERYLYRRWPFEVSLPTEIGYGHSRYELSDPANDKEVARGIFIPVGIGVSMAYQFPYLRWFKPLRWFGFNVLTGYRFVLKKDIPESQINYSGLYLSVGPSFFLENLTADIKTWRKRQKARKRSNS